MPKPSLLYASPFPPKQSGIADYSAGLVRRLSAFFDVTLYIDKYELSDPELSEFPVLKHGVDRVNFEKYHYRLYHVGNCPWFHGYIYEAALNHPGVVVLHEGVLYFLVVGMYINCRDFFTRIYKIGGSYAISTLKYILKQHLDPLRFVHPEILPLNSELLESANRIVVHSDYARRAFDIPRAKKIELAAFEPRQHLRRTRKEILASRGIPEEARVIGSLGFVAPTKLNHLACRAIQRLHAEGREDVYYLMIGEGDYISSYLSERIRVTGFVSDEEFDECLACCDLVLNMRLPTMGETSAALLRAMQFARPCIVTDLGWFSELPDNVVLKIDVSRQSLIEEHLYEAILIFLEQPGPFERMGKEALEYVRRVHNPEAVAADLHRFITSSGGDLREFAAATDR